ncbi:hypothetical protein [Aquamicrobium sp.]|uniref:hypothetical protein n=1 Tax=Aquamicrobium sp. TaxID=1872579 RepID=UPI00258EB2B5|nr:hypothetical protein [Aquamicrobium sp.]MCK9553490.1 hypothetical protein [Aquamicrobium sp.]
MRTIDIHDLDTNLLADLAGNAEDYAAYEADYAQTTVSNQCYHIAYNAADQRGGIVFVGSGSSGETSWTDAASPDEVLARYLDDEMIG